LYITNLTKKYFFDFFFRFFLFFEILQTERCRLQNDVDIFIMYIMINEHYFITGNDYIDFFNW